MTQERSRNERPTTARRAERLRRRKLTIIEWSEDVDVKRGLFLCDSSGVVLDDLQAGIQAKGFEFTAYVQWDGFREMSDRLWRADTDETLAPVVESAKSKMREHFKLRRDENKRTIVQNWKDQRVYPYSDEPQRSQPRSPRDLFDVVAKRSRDRRLGLFDRGDITVPSVQEALRAEVVEGQAKR